MATRLKVKCDYKSPQTQPTESGKVGGPVNLQFSPVYSGSEENKLFFAATPGGSFQFWTVNQSAHEQFEMGKEYYIDIFAAE